MVACIRAPANQSSRARTHFSSIASGGARARDTRGASSRRAGAQGARGGQVAFGIAVGAVDMGHQKEPEAPDRRPAARGRAPRPDRDAGRRGRRPRARPPRRCTAGPRRSAPPAESPPGGEPARMFRGRDLPARVRAGRRPRPRRGDGARGRRRRPSASCRKRSCRRRAPRPRRRGAGSPPPRPRSAGRGTGPSFCGSRISGTPAVSASRLVSTIARNRRGP
jgi:hypothetical protein